MSLEGKQKLLKKEHQLWQILPAHFSESPKDFQQTMPILAPILGFLESNFHQKYFILGAALNERPDLRLKALASIRAALQMDDQSTNIMRRFAKNFLPILFSIYTNDQVEEENSRKVDPKAVHLSTLETLRLYMRHIPAELLKQYISVALKKLTGPDVPKGQISEKNVPKKSFLKFNFDCFLSFHWPTFSLQCAFPPIRKICNQFLIASNHGLNLKMGGC